MFEINDSIHIALAAPTGAAAFSLGGQTLHRLFCVKTTKKDKVQKKKNTWETCSNQQ